MITVQVTLLKSINNYVVTGSLIAQSQLTESLQQNFPIPNILFITNMDSLSFIYSWDSVTRDLVAWDKRFNTLGFGHLGFSTLGFSTLGFSTLGFSALGFFHLGFSTLGFSTLGFSTLGFSTLGFSALGFFHLGFSH